MQKYLEVLLCPARIDFSNIAPPLVCSGTPRGLPAAFTRFRFPARIADGERARSRGDARSRV